MTDIVGALIGADSTSRASKRQAAAVREGNAMNMEMFNTVNRQNAPALAARNASIYKLAEALGIDPAALMTNPVEDAALESGPKNNLFDYLRSIEDRGDAPSNQLNPGYTTGSPNFGSLTRTFTGADLANDPGYKFRLSQGMNALQGSAAARGGLYSGAALKGITDYGQGMASNEFGQAYNRDASAKDRLYNMLSGLAGLGSSVSSQTQGIGANMALNNSGNLIGLGNAQAAAGMARGNMWGNALNSVFSQGHRNNWWGLGGGGYNPGADMLNNAPLDYMDQ